MGRPKGAKNKKNRKPKAQPPANGAVGIKGAVERKRFTQSLPVKIDAERVAVHAASFAAVYRQREATLELRREAMAGFREKLTGFDQEMEKLSVSVEKHTEMRDVECVEYLLPDNEVQVVRVDTGEILDKRTAEADDLQEPLVLEEDPEDERDDGFDHDVDPELLPKGAIKGPDEVARP